MLRCLLSDEFLIGPYSLKITFFHQTHCDAHYNGLTQEQIGLTGGEY
jgi:hypothetical protein